jgi:hypothetical protein
MMRALILLHRWLGVAFCLLFAMWFASGIVMHFVPFPSLAEADRFAGLAAIDSAGVTHGPAEAVAASGLAGATRVRLLQRADGAVYVISGPSGRKALRAADLSDAAMRSGQLAAAIAAQVARHRGLDSEGIGPATAAAYDQWTVAGQYDPHRPLYRVALHDDPGTELYVSSTTGEVVLETTRRERAWNYAGSVAHWIYPVILRSHATAWAALVWWLSLFALLGAIAGATVGTMRIGAEGSRVLSPYRGWQALHHWLGLCCMIFVLTWMFSGWLSMDDGLIFSTGKPSGAEVAAVSGAAEWTALPPDEAQHLGREVREAEWFAFAGKIYRRERTGAGDQRLYLAGSDSGGARNALDGNEISVIASRLAPQCKAPFVVAGNDDYAPVPVILDAPVFRLVCGEVWFDIDGSSGAVLQKLDASARAYRWLFAGLHRFDFPALTARPILRTALIVGFCGFGFLFSLTGVVIAWRRLRLSFAGSPGTSNP